MTAVAQEFNVTRVRVWQMLNPLKLDQRIIDYLLGLKNPKEINLWTERKLRKLLCSPQSSQYDEFEKMIAQAEFSVSFY